ncbi:MAG: peptidoglycan DD-metalloendopeptidase family protein, partial [Ginsengibacter sp.]
YLKYYRNYREKQGENIVKTRIMIEDKIAILSGTKQRKNNVLDEKGKELTQLEGQQKEKSEIVNELKGKTKEITKQLNQKRAQDVKLKNAITVMIKREIAAAKEEAARKEKERLEKIRKDKEIADALKKKEEDELKKKNANTAVTKTNPIETPTPEKPKVVAPPVAPAPKPKSTSVLVNSEADVTLNANFEKNKGSLPWPTSGYVIAHYGLNSFPGGNDYYNQGVTIGAKVGEPVKSIFDGEVTLVSYVNRNQIVCVKHGKYFTIYSNLESVSVQKGSQVKTGQVLGKVGLGDEGDGGSIDFLLMNEDNNVNPESWLRK